MSHVVHGRGCNSWGRPAGDSWVSAPSVWRPDHHTNNRRPHYHHQGQNGTANFVTTRGLWGWEPYNYATDDDKTLFLTFSKGFPVTKDEVVELLTRKYGEGSVVSVMMFENVVCGDQQTLFAKMMMRSVTVVDEVLGGNKIAKFRINEKHIWAKKYERREQTTTFSVPPAQM
ncbi:hypothetical protein LINPERHAP2_LOCUS28311 [Linum perenne]